MLSAISPDIFVLFLKESITNEIFLVHTERKVVVFVYIMWKFLQSGERFSMLKCA